MGLRCHYFESLARSEGPSTTGRILMRVPGVNLYTQYPGWADSDWHYAGSVLDSYAPGQTSPRSVERMVVTLGVEKFGFRRLLERLLAVVPADVQVTWQTGHTDVTGLDLNAEAFIPSEMLEQRMREADVVIAHSGVGSALTAMDNGRCPVLVPRSAERGEHVDDHQVWIAEELQRRGIGLLAPCEALDWSGLRMAATRSVVTQVPEPIQLL